MQIKICTSLTNINWLPILVTNFKSISMQLYLNNSIHKPVPNNSTFEIHKYCKCILECLMTLTPPA